MLGPYLVFLASTINGYEGTGRSLSLKLLQQLRVQAVPLGANTNAKNAKDSAAATGRTLHEVSFKILTVKMVFLTGLILLKLQLQFLRVGVYQACTVRPKYLGMY